MNKRTFASGLIASILAAVVCTGPAYAQPGNGGKEKDDSGTGDIYVHGKNPHEDAPAPTAGGTGSLSPITNHGGPVMSAPTAYLIWYGNWNQGNGSDTPAGQHLVRTFLGGVGNSPYFQINSTYAGVNGGASLSGLEYTDTGSLGTRLNDNNIRTLVANAIGSGRLGPADSRGVYFVLTSSNIAKTGFCSQYCGWHTATTINGVPVKYSFVGNANRCLNACAAQTVGPNGNAGVDGMISVVAHELEEATTDPQLNAWYDSSGAENADKCAWTFGSGQKLLPNGAYYNMTVAGLNFLVQRNLQANNNKCYVSYNGQQ
jgi:Phosphate-induced protein 1 conserved region